jgi:hypothetical protein
MVVAIGTKYLVIPYVKEAAAEPNRNDVIHY